MQIVLKTPPLKDIDLSKYSEEDREKIRIYYEGTGGEPGFGAGNEPIIAQLAAEYTLEEIKELLKGTKMVFLTASMGGGSGTGATSVIAKACKDLNILTVGIVTLPFIWEGKLKMRSAWKGVENMKPYVDDLLIILNDRLTDKAILEKYRDKLSIADDGSVEPADDEIFKLADNVLADAVKSVVEIVDKTGYMDLDFADINAALKNGGGTIMDFGFGTGDDRFYTARNNALGSPLLQNIDISKATKIILAVFSSEDYKFSQREFDEIKRFSKRFADEYWFKLGMYRDNTLGERAKVTIIATGANDEDILPSEIMEILNMPIIERPVRYEDKSPLKILDDQRKLTEYQENTAYSRI
jgi:cell division protein FtsZ